MLLAREEAVQDQAQEVVAQRAKESLGAEQSRETRPPDLFLQLVKAEAVRVQEHRGRASGNVIAQESEDIDQNWKTKGDDESSRTANEVSARMAQGPQQRILTVQGTRSREALRRAS